MKLLYQSTISFVARLKVKIDSNKTYSPADTFLSVAGRTLDPHPLRFEFSISFQSLLSVSCVDLNIIRAIVGQIL